MIGRMGYMPKRGSGAAMGALAKQYGGRALGALRQIADSLPAAYLAGREGMGAAQEYEMRRQHMAAQQDARQRAQALMGDLQGVDPTTPEGLRTAVQTFAKHGFYDEAGRFLDMMQSGQLERFRVGAAMAQKGMEAPKTRTRQEGREKVTEEWDPRTQTWTEVGRGPMDAPEEVEPPDWKAVKSMGESYAKRGGAAFQEVSDAFSRIDAAYDLYNRATTDAEKAQAYQAMNVALQKLLDPGSVVRESEFARTEQFQGLVARFETLVERMSTGSVSSELLAGIHAMGKALYTEAAEKQVPRYEAFERRAKRFGFEPEDVLLGFDDPRSVASAGSTSSVRVE